MTKYKARNGSNLSDEQADSYGKHLAKLLKKTGKITPEEVVSDAKNENTPYHDYFDWDDSVAAFKHRLYQARSILNSIMEVTIVRDDPEPVVIRSFYNVVFSEERAYVAKDLVFSDDDLSRQVVERALREVRAWLDRYRHYRALSSLVVALDNAFDNLEVRKNDSEA